ncbi:MAG: phosphate regulon sensor histidine kinase PhoR [Gammaproteobacteria bacterium]|nr:phosphate regulon sensor histidine kinase PhoR [Gammaproteobacteria bacterium]MBU1732170.1 phosphate regulon sensor histidine kinase PhoR [Gammaproteobacteria bacterium]MBU1893300.1 phosphate regulon sensor histidine kinase PhoR [Gammaproteobacteria bacterium]
MSGLWGRLLWSPIAAALMALIIWPLFGAVLALFLFSAFLLLLWLRNAMYFTMLVGWLQSPSGTEVPEASGVWDEVFSVLYQSGRMRSTSQNELSAVLERFQRAAEAMPDGIIMINQAGQIEWCNPAAENQFDISNLRDLGQRLSYLVRQAQFTEYLVANNYAEPLVMKSARNAELTLSIQLVPFGDRQKMLLSRDVTHLERVETMRRDFIANVSHELRTPLTVVGGFLEGFAEAEQVNMEQSRRHFQLMLDQTRRMQGLVDDLLTLSRLESNQEKIFEETVDVCKLLEILHKEAISLSAGRHRLDLQINTDAKLTGNERELRSAFGNLVSNAVRYTPEGGEITLRWSMDGQEARFCVQDSGIGIEPQYISRLTERFYRVDRGRSRETGGTGLGLSIVKHILTRHQGRLDVESVHGKGSTFCACFPARRVVNSER